MLENNDQSQPVCELKPQKVARKLSTQEVFDLFLGAGAVMSGVRERIEGE